MLSRGMRDIFKTQIELLQMKTTMPEMKSTLDGINNRSDTEDKKTGEFQDREAENIQNETQKGKRNNNNNNN